MKRTKHKLLAGVLTVALLLQTAMPSALFAAELAPKTAVLAAEAASKTIVGISALEQTKYDLSIGANQAVIDATLTFPKTITAEVEYFVTEEVTPLPAPPVQDSGKQEQPSEQPAKLPVTEEMPAPEQPPVTEEAPAEGETPDLGVSGNPTEKPRVASDSNIPEKDEEPTVDEDETENTTLVEKKVTEKVTFEVTWESGKPLSTEEAGEFIYTATLTDEDEGKYDFAEGVRLPEITVTVGAAVLMARTGSIVEVDTVEKFRSAFTGAQDGDTIQVTGTIDLGTAGVTLTGKTVTLNLNGKTVTYSGSKEAISLSSGASLTITDSSDEKKGELKSTALGIAIYIGGSTLEISSGTVSATADGTAIKNTSSDTSSGIISGTVTVSGGVVLATGKGTAIQNSSGTVTVSGGVVLATSTDATAIQNGGTINEVTNGLILGSCTGSDAVGLAWTCTGDMTLPQTVEIPNGTTFTVKQGATLIIPSGVTLTNNGIIKKIGTIIGTVNGNQPKEMVTEVTAKDGTTTEYYSNIEDTFRFAPEGSTVKLLVDVALGGANAVIITRDTLTLDLNGKVLTSTEGTVVTYRGSVGGNGKGTFTIQDSGSSGGGRVENIGVGIAVKNICGGTVLISDGTMKSSSTQAAIYNGSAGTVSVTSGTVVNTGAGGAIENISTGTVSVTGGTVINTNWGNVIINGSTGKITISDEAKVTSNVAATILLQNGGTETANRLVITGGTVESNGVEMPAIQNNSTGGVEISGGTVSGKKLHAISNNTTGSITISGGTVSAAYSAVENNSTGKVKITGGTLVGAEQAVCNATGKVDYTGGIIWGDCTGRNADSIPAGMAWSVKGTQTLPMDLTLPTGKTFTVPSGAALTIAQGKTVTNNGTIKVYGTLNYGAPTYGAIIGNPPKKGSTATVAVLKEDGTAFGSGENPKFGDTVQLKVTAVQTPPNRARAATADKAVFYFGSAAVEANKLGEAAVSYDSTNKTATATLLVKLDRTSAPWSSGTNAIFADFGGSSGGNLLDSTAATSVTIVKALAPTVAAPANIPMVKGQVREYTFDLSRLVMPQNAGKKTYTVASPSDARLFTANPTVDAVGKTLKFTSAKVDTEDSTSTVEVKIASDNYETTTVTLTFKITKQIPVTISGISVASRAYNGAAAAYTGTPIAKNGEDEVPLSGYDYAWSTAAGVSLTEAPKNAGDYRLTVSVKASDTQYIGSVDVPFSISKAALTIKADDKSAKVGAAQPALTYTATGIAPGESLKTVPTLTTNADMSKAGEYTITAKDAEVPNEDNYDTIITYTDGKLTVTTNSGGGSTGSGSSSSGGGSVTPPVTPDSSNPPTTAESDVSSKTDKNGSAKAAVAGKDITDAIQEAQKEADKNGTEANGIAITLDVKTSKKATKLGVTLSKQSVSDLVAAKVTQVTVKNSLSTVTLDLATLKALAGGKVTLTISKANTAKLSKNAQKAIGKRPVFQYSLTRNGKKVSNFKGGKAGLEIAYTPTTAEQMGNLCGIYVDASGKVKWLEASSYDPITGRMLISAQHFSTYGIGYKKSTSKFTDVSTHWAKNDIDFVVARGLLSGTSTTTFAPDASMTRGMFVTALGRLAGVNTKKYKNTKFTDVKASAYYAPYVAWANAANITAGTTDTTFSPNKAITRQEMAVMLVNYSKAIGYKLPSVHAEVRFADAGSMASGAKDAVKQMQMAGILMGKSGNQFAPAAAATRAEVSAMLRRYVELMANTETAEGWTMNESGQWMYIQDGKRVTGKQTIDGESYTFDQYGVTTTLPPKRK